MGDPSPQGWYTDPFRVHEARYFSAGRPTKLVRDGDIESYDEPPPESYDPADVAAGGHRFGNYSREVHELVGVYRRRYEAAVADRALKLATIVMIAIVTAVIAIVTWVK